MFKNNVEIFKNLIKMYSNELLANDSTEFLAKQQLIQLPIWIMHLTSKCNYYKDHKLQLLC